MEGPQVCGKGHFEAEQLVGARQIAGRVFQWQVGLKFKDMVNKGKFLILGKELGVN